MAIQRGELFIVAPDGESIRIRRWHVAAFMIALARHDGPTAGVVRDRLSLPTPDGAYMAKLERSGYDAAKRAAGEL